MKTLSVRLTMIHHTPPLLRLPLLLALLLFGAACSGTSAVTDPASDPTTDPVGDDLSQYEDFDPSPYTETLPSTSIELVHDVPSQLMESRAAQGTMTTLQGYRIQVSNTLDKQSALQQEQSVKVWWRNLDPAERPERLFPDDLPVYVLYRQPYYRIRVGDFLSRTEAERALAFMEGRFPGAFIAPDMVTVVR